MKYPLKGVKVFGNGCSQRYLWNVNIRIFNLSENYDDVFRDMI